MHRPDSYYVGSAYRSRMHFYDEDCVDVDPEAVVFHYRKPCGSRGRLVYGSDQYIGREDAGRYWADVILSESGRWWFRWEAVDSGSPFSQERDLIVQKSKFETTGADYT